MTAAHPAPVVAGTVVSFNSCRNRHCPKCQGAAARKWLSEREAELFDTDYFRLVFTLPAAVANIAWQNKAVVYNLLFKAAAEATLTIAVDSRHLGCPRSASPPCSTRALSGEVGAGSPPGKRALLSSITATSMLLWSKEAQDLRVSKVFAMGSLVVAWFATMPTRFAARPIASP